MAFSSRRETYDSNTPSDPSSRTPYRRSQKYQESISNSSVHTNCTPTYEDLFDYSEQHPGGIFSISHRKSFHSLEKSTFRFRNQSQSSVGTTRETGSVRSSTATPISEQEIRSLNIPSFEDDDEFPNDLLLKASAPLFPDSDPGGARAREGRALESKVARVASRKCPVEEVVALQKEVDRWLTEVTAADSVRVPSSSSSPVTYYSTSTVHSALLEFPAAQGHPHQSRYVLRSIQGC